MGYGGNWITDWYAYDADAGEILGLRASEKVAGFILLGTPREPPMERERPNPAPLVTRWRGQPRNTTAGRRVAPPGLR